jgi:hypothetical protein
MSASDRVQLLYRNAKQMKKIVAATFPSPAFEDKVMNKAETGLDCMLDVEVCRCSNGTWSMLSGIGARNSR